MNKYNNKYHRRIIMKPLDLKPSMYIDFNKELIRKFLNLKVMIMLEYQNKEIFLQKTMFQIGLKTLCHGHMLLVILTEKKLLELFIKKNYKKQIKKSLEWKRLYIEKGINYMLSGKPVICGLRKNNINDRSVQIHLFK